MVLHLVSNISAELDRHCLAGLFNPSLPVGAIGFPDFPEWTFLIMVEDKVIWETLNARPFPNSQRPLGDGVDRVIAT